MVRVEYVAAALFEHRFWLQVLGDHARFIRDSLAPGEKEAIRRAKGYVTAFDGLLENARRPVTDPKAVRSLTGEAKQAAEGIREFKLSLVKAHLTASIGISLSPSFLNHMVNEVEEYLRLLSFLCRGEVPPREHPVHHHLLWLQDAYGHSSALAGNLDFVEKSWKKKSDRFTQHFEAFYLKAVELAGYLRTCLADFPALRRFHREVELEMALFQNFLQELEEFRLNKEVLGVLTPLMADHMFREECYYLTKLAASSHTQSPPCDPAEPRQEG
ncbi:protein of unknown function (DUF2935) [Melghirimyces profundicolus]|uniref:DUF2935 family protein n=1 Tax=Melghirimyces profundicolus TaxID=1242148 RepID=A0A2T6BGE3_9BACL|nr:DUF2935 domain-containing protein [Melghirimyces profundicolus]PTX55129.1 protein of unknown function (DUF2935) [Melghirimyces profundicolus]